MGFTLEVENFKCLKKVAWSPSGVCALVGPNGAGKTTLLQSIAFARDFLLWDITRAGESCGGAAYLRNWAAAEHQLVTIAFQLGTARWTFIVGTPGGRYQLPVGETFSLNGEVLTSIEPGVVDGTTHGRPFAVTRSASATSTVGAFHEDSGDLERLRRFGFFDEPVVRHLRERGSSANSEVVLNRTGANLFSLLRNWTAGRFEHKERFAFVEGSMRDAFPELYETMEFEVAGPIVSINFLRTLDQISFGPHLAPDGLLRALIHLCAVASAPEHGILAIDEFENGLHPFAIKSLIESIRRRAEKLDLTVILATHSPVVLNEFNACPENVFVMDARSDEPQPVALDKLEDREWLANFSLGWLYAQEQFGEQGQKIERKPLNGEKPAGE